MSKEFDPLDTNAQVAAELQDDAAKRLSRLRENGDLTWLMGLKQGRRIMWRLLELTGVFRNPFTGNREMTDFRCGEMNIGQKLLVEIHQLCPEHYHTMVREHINATSRERTSNVA
jgi:hypothetical protein